ncbi:MAG: hypothetical protein IT479_03830 [Xanthomonadales bacterium]|nr:hypothetical protein [Xanthomonadales bacterium]MCC6592382.1 hypothetical protein [Xanthomonadales bacterium]MCE7932384.1 hypothetical protein [Xanthomonadales bacterium PRO6]
MKRLSLIGCCLSAALAACSGDAPETAPPVEVVAPRPLELRIDTQGELRSAKATPLTVPGSNWATRQLVWMKPEGSAVQAGEVVARFSADRSLIDLAEARVQLLRNALARAAKQSELVGSEARIDAEIAQVDTELAIAERYASAELLMIARNELLDAIQDRDFLGDKQDFLGWKRAQTGQRGSAELAVLDSQKQTHALNARIREEDLKALELVAPHAGFLMLTPDWSGEKPRVGASMWASQELGSLPDPASLEVQFSLPQLDAAGIKVGARVELTPLGRSAPTVTTTLSWVATAAQPVSRNNPIKHVRMKAAVDAALVERLGLVPGQSLALRIYPLRLPEGLSVPNVAIISGDGASHVELWTAGRRERRAVRLGERGLARTQVLDGLTPGDAVVLTPQRAESST